MYNEGLAFVSFGDDNYLRDKKSEKLRYEGPQKGQIIYLVLTYYKGADEIKEKIKKLVGDCFPQVDFRLILKSHSFIGKTLVLKTKLPKTCAQRSG